MAASKQVIQFMCSAYCNPLLLLFFILHSGAIRRLLSIASVEAVPSNKIRLDFRWYLLLAPALYLCWLMLEYAFLETFDPDLEFQDLFRVYPSWLSYIAMGFSALLLSLLARSGMEANVFGFILFGPLILSCMTHGGIHLYWIWESIL